MIINTKPKIFHFKLHIYFHLKGRKSCSHLLYPEEGHKPWRGARSVRGFGLFHVHHKVSWESSSSCSFTGLFADYVHHSNVTKKMLYGSSWYCTISSGVKSLGPPSPITRIGRVGYSQDTLWAKQQKGIGHQFWFLAQDHSAYATS